MSKYILSVTSSAKAGKDEEFRNWYKMFRYPSCLRCRDLSKVRASDDIQATMNEMKEHSKRSTRSEAIF